MKICPSCRELNLCCRDRASAERARRGQGRGYLLMR
jgi:hypothetical protein